jgi:hypothetical protein
VDLAVAAVIVVATMVVIVVATMVVAGGKIAYWNFQIKSNGVPSPSPSSRRKRGKVRLDESTEAALLLGGR